MDASKDRWLKSLDIVIEYQQADYPRSHELFDEMPQLFTQAHNEADRERRLRREAQDDIARFGAELREKYGR